MPLIPEEADNQENSSSSEQNNTPSSQSNKNIPEITLPKGGGSVSGIGEKFQANPVTGTGNTNIPLPVSPGRNGFTPALALQYDSGNGNSPFGIGWNVGIPSIVRKTQKGLPKYQDNNESDIFILAGSEDLVPALEQQGNEWIPIKRTENSTFIQFYRPRTEGLFARIEKHTNINSGVAYWRVTTKDNTTTVYGESENARIFDSEKPERIFEWLIEYTYDEKGNITLYEYKSENSEGIPKNALSERNRISSNNSFNNKYIKAVKYNPDISFNTSNSSFFDTVKWNFQLIFDYGEHDQNNPTINEINNWPIRQDPFSSYRSGFEIRTYRLCQRVLMFHFFENDLGSSPVLVKSTDISYDKNPVLTQIAEITQRCYKAGEPTESYPPINFEYTKATIDPNIHRYSIDDAGNLPIGVDGQQYRWVDLFGEGLQGVLSEDNNAWYFKENLGDENYHREIPVNTSPAPEARLSSIKKVAETPSTANLNNGSQQLTDLDGDGTLDLVINNAATQGYYTQDKNNKWNNYIPFEAYPNIDFNDPNVRIMDVNGDGFPDIIMTEENCFTIYHSEGKKGFSPSYRTLKSFDDEQGPAIIFADSDQSVYLADMSGDGLTDIVSIRNGSVCYWPNMGYGEFGNKVSMDNVPLFDYQDLFNQQHVRLADIDGSGTTDILYIGNNDVRYYPNQSGNSFGEATIINERLPTHNLAGITALDILGNGTQCLVWSSPVPGDHPPAIKFIDLMGGVKPYLMTEMNNNMGSLTRLKYAPSTKFYLKDKRAGTPWITKLPFPVQVVEQVELFDEIGRNRFVTKYAYHHGYFDGTEREFRGFGMVEQTDTETFTDFTEGGLFPPGVNASEEVLHVPPVLTKTWFHTGFYEEGSKILGQYEKEYWTGDIDAISLEHTLQTRASYIENREAARALRGSALRQELYSLDGSAVETNPYAVTENNYELVQIQPRGDQNRRDRDYGVYLVTPGETLSYQYERNPADPRISHQLTLETDRYGNVLQAAAVAYSRRVSQGYMEQDATLITYAQNTVLNEDNNPSFYRIGVPLESRNYEITGFTASTIQTRTSLLAEITSATEIPFEAIPDGSLQKRLIDHSRVLYYDESLDENTPLTFGQVASHGLPFETYQLAFTPDLIINVLNENTTRVDDTVFTDGQYRDLLSDGHYWVPSGKTIFDAANFYLPIAQEDPFGNRGLIAYDAYNFLPLQTTDAVGNITTAEYDYRILQPDLVTDPNGNQQAFQFDVRGMVNTIAIMGKIGGNDGDTLADPTSTFQYDLFRWMNEQKPNFAYSRTRELHANTNTRYLESYAYSDGLGQAIMTKTLVAPGDAFSRDANGDLIRDVDDKLVLAQSDPRWVGSGRTILDNKGNPVKQYEAYFSSTSEYESETELVEYGVTPIIRYDPLGRAIKTDLPDDTITRVEFTPWEQKNYDQNDTVLESLWYIQRNAPDPLGTEPTDPDERAAWLAAAHADTPQVITIDNLGRPFITTDSLSRPNGGNNGPDGQYSVTTKLDIKGNPTQITDAKGRVSFTYTYNLLNQPIKTTHIDNGTRYALGNAVGNPLRAWDNRDQAFISEYDELQRPTKTWLHNFAPGLVPGSTGGPAINTGTLLSLTVYGEKRNNPENRNLRGQPYLIFDSSGMTNNVRFDFKSNLLRTQKSLTTDFQNIPDWSILDGINNTNTILNTADTLLEAETFLTINNYDALNRPRTIRTPDNSRIMPRYDEGGQLTRINTRVRNAAPAVRFVDTITYNARGQRRSILYGNATATAYTYDPLTFRLDRLRTTRNGGSDVLQDLQYTYDPVGNITTERDDAQEVIFFDNAQVVPHGKYTYDALYRLIQAEGREKKNIDEAPGPGDPGIQPIPSGQNTAVRGYIEQYNYDELGNILQLIHTSTRAQNSWNKYYHYDNTFSNNYLQSTSTDNVVPTNPDYTYDTHGNMTAMPHLSNMTWDYADRLQSADMGGGSTVYFTYDANGERVRKVRVNASGRRWERIYLGSFELYRVVNGGGNLRFERQTLHILDDKSRVALVDTLTVSNGNPVGSPDSVFRYQLNNHLETASLELDENADIITYEEFYPFGSTSYRAGRSNSEVNDKRYRYVGKEKDDETGLYYYGARYYASWLCRFVSTDPLKDDYPQLNSYNYAGNKPITFKDIDGNQGSGDEIIRKGIPTAKDATNITPIQGKAQAFELAQKNGNSTIGESENQVAAFLEELAVITIKGVINLAGAVINNKNNAGFSVKPEKVTIDQLKQQNQQTKDLLNPSKILEGTINSAFDAGKNLSEGIKEGDGRKLARVVPFALEVAGGVKAFIRPNLKSIPKQNSNLVTKIKNNNPDLSNADVADIATPNLKIPEIPFGFTQETFVNAQSFLKNELNKLGITDAEGFATGSRVAGTTLNPTPNKAAKFGVEITDFTKPDLDITIISSNPLEKPIINKLRSDFRKEFGIKLGVRFVTDTRQLNNLSIHGQIPLNLK